MTVSDIISFSAYTSLFKHLFRAVITMPGNSTVPLLISGVFNCHDFPCHLKSMFHDLFEILGCFIPTPCIFKYEPTLVPSPTQGQRTSCLNLPHFRQQKSCLTSASAIAKKCVFLLGSSTSWCDFILFHFPPNYSLPIILHLKIVKSMYLKGRNIILQQSNYFFDNGKPPLGVF